MLSWLVTMATSLVLKLFSPSGILTMSERSLFVISNENRILSLFFPFLNLILFIYLFILLFASPSPCFTNAGSRETLLVAKIIPFSLPFHYEFQKFF